MFCFFKRMLKYFLYFILVITVLTIGFIVYSVWFQPPFFFPKPTGQYAVGVVDYHWIDATRKEIFATDPEHPNRELMVKVWYPSEGLLPEKPTTPYAPYLIEYMKQNQSVTQGLIKFSKDRYSYAKPNVTLAIDKTQFPIIIFSHGYGGTRDSNTANCEELASRGYIVVGISHTYDSCVVEFPDGRIVDGIKSMKNRKHTENFVEDHYQELEIWINDVRFVLDQIEKLANEKISFFYQRLDLKNIAMFGHSYGGATTAQVCRLDSRVKAGVDLDGPLYGPNATEKFDKPFMFILAQNTIASVNRPWTQSDQRAFSIYSPTVENMFKSRYTPTIKLLAESMPQNVCTFVIKDAGHMAFSDMALAKHASFFSYVFGGTSTGSIDGFCVTEIVNAYLVNFFDKYLKGKPSELLNGRGKKYEEVEQLK
ncbi:MAG: hypothetical protein V1646_00280 [bacterium]